MIRRALAWIAAVAASLGVLGVILYAAAAHQPRVAVTTDEVIPPSEADTIMRLVRKATVASAEESKTDHLYKRDAHAQPHGCVIALLEVYDAIEPDHQQGVFADPGHRYKAWVRFSNGTQADDTQPDARGMAIKLMGVRGPKLLDRREDPERKTQDFVMVNYHTFFLRTVEEYEEFFDYQAKNRPTAYFFAGPPWRWQLHEFYHGAHMLYQRVASPLATTYYSMSAYRFGDPDEERGHPAARNAKFSARPCTPPTEPMPSPRGPHYLRDALVRDLGARDACFELAIQLQNPAKNMPIEDVTIQWDERDAPYVPVARLFIPRQEFSTDVQNRFCENLQFAPWHGLPAHRPVGSLNRARGAVYRAVSQRRHNHNGSPRGEPRGWCLHFGPCPPSEERARLADVVRASRPDAGATR
jgi:hypothetical protein